jgi:predicted ATP-dependent serine protease
VLRWASEVGCLLVATEMPPGQIREVAPSAGVHLDRVHFLTELPKPGVLLVELQATEVQALVVDSVSKIPARPELIVADLIRICRAARVAGFAIVHESAKGRPRTRTVAEHDPDLTLRVTPAGKGFAQVSIGKNRFAPVGSVRVTLGTPK